MNNIFHNPSISVIGAGNVAHSLVPALLNAQYTVDYLYSKTPANTKKLAEKHNIKWTTNIKDLRSDIIILAVADSALDQVITSIPAKSNQIIVHTAGSQPITLISHYHKNAGVLYPLQTFSAQRKVDFKEVPICLETNNKFTEKQLTDIANSISSNVRQVSSHERLQIHTAAVFVCNFSNLMYTYGKDILDSSGLPFDVLRPLIKETAEKALSNDPETVQTGPAIRNDEITLTKHINQLNDDLSKKYIQLSEWIKKRHS